MKLLVRCVFIFLIAADGLDGSQEILSSWGRGGRGRWHPPSVYRSAQGVVNVRAFPVWNRRTARPTPPAARSTTTTPAATTTTTTTPRAQPSTPSISTEEFSTSLSQHRNFGLIPVASCGQEEGHRIVGGDEAGLTQFPWMAHLLYDGEYHCGGALINSRYVITAAHCIPRLNRDYYTKLVGVTLGEHDLRTDPDCQDNVCLSSKKVTIEDVIPHPDFRRNRAYDLALLRLSESVDFKDNISPICLPMNEQVSTYKVNDWFLFAGWGYLANDTLANVKQVVGLMYMEEAKCKASFRTILNPTLHVCAGGTEAGKDSCNGDSGGPLVTVKEMTGTLRFILAGVLSQGHQICGTEGVPGIYVKPFPNMLWILDNIRP